MKQFTSAFISLALATGCATAGDQTFVRTKTLDIKGNQSPVNLVFSDSRATVEVRGDGKTIVELPYRSIDGFGYQFSEKHRITQGALVMVASLGVGAVVMLTKSRVHFLTIDYRDAAEAKQHLVLRLDKTEYLDVLAAATAQTGRDVSIRLAEQKR